MEKVIQIGGIDCRLKSSAAVARLYRLYFGDDLIVDMNQLTEDVAANKGALQPRNITTLEQYAYVCHKHADPSQPETIDEWLDQFEDSAIYLALGDIISLWKKETESKSTSKKKSESRPDH